VYQWIPRNLSAANLAQSDVKCEHPNFSAVFLKWHFTNATCSSGIFVVAHNSKPVEMGIISSMPLSLIL